MGARAGLKAWVACIFVRHTVLSGRQHACVGVWAKGRSIATKVQEKDSDSFACRLFLISAFRLVVARFRFWLEVAQTTVGVG